MKRFYKDVTLEKTSDGYAVLLDGRSVKTPSKKPLIVPSSALAELVAQEWRVQAEKIDLSAMYLTRLSYGVLELEDADRQMLREETLEYITTELMCYRDSERPVLWQQQVEQWDPQLAWARDALGIELDVTASILPVAVSDVATHTALTLINGLDDWRLVPFALLVRVLGSLILAFGVLHGRINAHEAMRLAHLEQDYQALQWGVDVDTQARRAAALREAEAVGRCFGALGEL